MTFCSICAGIDIVSFLVFAYLYVQEWCQINAKLYLTRQLDLDGTHNSNEILVEYESILFWVLTGAHHTHKILLYVYGDNLKFNMNITPRVN